jgi:hypothetical protein
VSKQGRSFAAPLEGAVRMLSSPRRFRLGQHISMARKCAASFLDRGGPLYELGPNESIEILGPGPVDFCPGLLESLPATGFNELFP